MGISSLVGAGISAAGSLFGASEKSSAAKQAAAYQEQAGQQAQGALSSGLSNAGNALSPYTSLGSSAAGTLGNDLGALSSSIATPTAQYVNPLGYGTDASPYVTSGTANNISGTADNVSALPYETTTNLSQSQLEQTPGYQFTLAQGEKGVQNSAAARGLGVSGAALKGASTYATGLADSTYQQQYQDELSSNAQNFSNALGAASTNFGQQATAASTDYGQQAGANAQNFSNALQSNQAGFGNALQAAGQNYGMDQTGFTDAQTNETNAYNKLYGTSALGESAGNALASADTSTAANTANALVGVGNAQAAGENASGQAYGSAFQGVGNSLATGINGYNAGQSMTGGTTFGNALTNFLKSGTSS